MTLKRIEIEESKPLDIETAKLFENLIQAKEKLAAKPTEFLGLYKTEKGIYANFYIGHWWIEEGKRYLWVKPRIFSFRDKRVTTDITRILEEIFRDEEVSKEFLRSMEHSDETKRVFGFDFVSQPIIVDKREIPNIKIFVVIAFLKTLTEIVNKGFRRDYIKVDRTLKNRVKGKILISQSIKQHLKRGLPLTNTCSYHEHSINSLENRILKTALLQVKNYFAKDREGKAFASSILKGSLVFLLREFESIEPLGGGKTIRNHFRKVRHNALFPEYKRALKLAKVILGFEDDKIEIPPYYINMWKLFELYVLKILRKEYKNILYQKPFKVLGMKAIPDFVILNIPAIADAKYSFLERKENIEKNYLEQLSFYSRIKQIREKTNKIFLLRYKTEIENILEAIKGIKKPIKERDKLNTIKLKLQELATKIPSLNLRDANIKFKSLPHHLQGKHKKQIKDIITGTIEILKEELKELNTETTIKISIEPKLILIYPKVGEVGEIRKPFEKKPLEDLTYFYIWYCYLPVRNI